MAIEQAGPIARLPSLARSSAPAPELQRTRTVESPGGDDFEESLSRVADAVNEPLKQAERAIGGFIDGSEGAIQETMVAMSKAEISFKMLMSVRNRIVDAYKEVMRTDI